MHTVLDLDLDFFVSPVATWPQWEDRAPDTDYQPDSVEFVRDFLETRCHLKRGDHLIGAQVVKHEEAFWTWKRWIEEGKLIVPFKVIHVDAHADLGLGDAGWMYLMTELLSLPVEQRSTPAHGKSSSMNEGNYLVFAVANRWISSVLYVYPDTTTLIDGGSDRYTATTDSLIPGDLLTYHFQNFDPLSRKLELKRYSKKGAEKLMLSSRNPSPIATEPTIPFDWAPANGFEFEGFTHVLVAQSPRYTPTSADHLLPIIGEYYVRG